MEGPLALPPIMPRALSHSQLSLNAVKCAFGVTSRTRLGHIVSKEGIVVDLGKIDAIIKSPTPKNAKQLGRFLGQLRWHNRMLRHLADFATPLHVVLHRTSFRWTKTEDKAYDALKIMLSQAPIVQAPDWTWPFHMFVDASDIAIDRYTTQAGSCRPPKGITQQRSEKPLG